MVPPAEHKSIMIIAGEASGDQHGAKLVRAIQAGCREINFFGIGGRAMRQAGVQIMVEANRLAVVGITEVVSKAPQLIHGLAVAKNLLKERQPDLLILIDFPDFNLHIAATAKKLGIPILYYICPQIWAWRPGRIKKIKKRVDHAAVILPFEADFFSRHKVPVTFVGHPLLDGEPSPVDDFQSGKNNGRRVIGLLPGSRDREIARLLPVLFGAIQLLSQKADDLTFLVSIAPSINRELVEQLAEKSAVTSRIEWVEGGVETIFKQSRLVVAASGTVTMEAALCGTPMIIIYKVSPITGWLARMLAKVDHIGLVNLIAGKRVVPELVQRQVSAANIADMVMDMLENDAKLDTMKKELLKVKTALGGPGASARAARIALDMISS